MKVSELIEILQDKQNQYGDKEVVGFWEGVTIEIVEKKIYLSKKGNIFIDVDEDDYYRKEFAVNWQDMFEKAKPLSF